MTKDEIIRLAKNVPIIKKELSMSDYLELRNIADISLIMGDDGETYYYSISIDDLIDKDFPVALITANGWQLSKDENNLIKVLI